MCTQEQVYSSPVWRDGCQGEGLFSGRASARACLAGTVHKSVGALEAAQPWERGRRSGAGMLSLALLAPGCDLPPGPLPSGLPTPALEGQREPSRSHGPGRGSTSSAGWR